MGKLGRRAFSSLVLLAVLLAALGGAALLHVIPATARAQGPVDSPDGVRPRLYLPFVADRGKIVPVPVAPTPTATP